jgi:hypothetical protein
MMDAVFQTTGQALHVAFLIMAVEPRQRNALRQALIRIIEEIEDPNPKLRQWLDQLRGESSGAVNFGGLTSDEVRAQCAMVTQVVKDTLPAPEMHVINARFIPTAVRETGRDEENRPISDYYFCKERKAAFQWLAKWLKESRAFDGLNQDEMTYLAIKMFAERPEIEISFRHLAQKYSKNHMTYFRSYTKAKELVRPLENMAMSRLAAHFYATGLVESGYVETKVEPKVWRFK